VVQGALLQYELLGTQLSFLGLKLGNLFRKYVAKIPQKNGVLNQNIAGKKPPLLHQASASQPASSIQLPQVGEALLNINQTA
jgi:hypothetical protein